MSSRKKTKKICLGVISLKFWQCFLIFFSEPEQQQLVKQRLWDEGPTLREEDEILREEDEVIFQILFSKLFSKLLSICQKKIHLSKF